MSTSLEEAFQSWEENTLAPALRRQPERKAHFNTSSNIPLQRLYLPTHPEPEYQDKLGFPGQYPFTRGVQPSMYRGRLWTMRQYAGYASAEESNRRYRYLLEQGQTGLSVAFDLPTQIGYDPDQPQAAGEVGRVGVSVCCLDDMARLFDGIPLDQVSTSMTINAPAAVLLAMYVALAKRQGVAPASLQGTIQNDILKEYAARGTYIFPPKPAMRMVTEIFRYCRRNVPQWNTISISGYHIREAGATAVQEVAFTLANALEYVQAAVQAGLPIDDFAPRLTFFFSAHNQLLEEVAKFRAARRLWAHLMRNELGAKDPHSWRLRFHTQTAGSTLTAQQPQNNVIRVTLQALAAVLGGTQSLHTNSQDEALGLPTQHAVQVALRTQQILACESGVPNTVDPLAGSFVVEQLTDEIEKRVQEYLGEIKQLGGALAAIERGYVQTEIQESAYRAQKALECGEQEVVGLNVYQAEEHIPLERFSVDPTIEQTQRQRLTEVRARRDQQRASQLLARVLTAAQGDEELMPLFVECMEAGVTLGEVCQQLRLAWGEYQAPAHLW